MVGVVEGPGVGPVVLLLVPQEGQQAAAIAVKDGQHLGWVAGVLLDVAHDVEPSKEPGRAPCGFNRLVRLVRLVQSTARPGGQGCARGRS